MKTYYKNFKTAKIKCHQFVADDVWRDVELCDEVDLVQRICGVLSQKVRMKNWDKFSGVQNLDPVFTLLGGQDDRGRVEGDGLEAAKLAVDGLVLNAEQGIFESKYLVGLDEVHVAEVDETNDQRINILNWNRNKLR